MTEKTIRSCEDLLNMLDQKFRTPEQFWDPFYTNREKAIPFFKNAPDENLVSYVDRNLIQPGKAMDLGCGPGRNSIYLAKQGFDVVGYDISNVAVQWARDRAEESKLNIRFECKSAFEIEALEQFDLVYDSGCLHHLLPHRRIQYIEMIYRSLKPRSYFGITCFRPGFGDQGGPVREMSDWDVYEEGTMNGGLAFSEEKIKYILEPYFECIEFRAVEQQANEEVFGVPFLWASLWRKKEAEASHL
ncbi:class I SAM-dependent methyltransferase [Paenibacillus sp. GCM10028914]|uniref:class I SAM-dependent methyltransferase n=1 Tax=Paenibacillus sp. GCM10028914 TaxID=3273416 RepID=UPI003611BF5E